MEDEYACVFIHSMEGYPARGNIARILQIFEWLFDIYSNRVFV